MLLGWAIAFAGACLIEYRGWRDFLAAIKNGCKSRKVWGYIALFLGSCLIYAANETCVQVKNYSDIVKFMGNFLSALYTLFIIGYCFARISSVDAKYLFDDYDNDKKNK